MNDIFRLQLDDYSAPSFISSAKDYFGTMEQIQSLFEYLRRDEDLAKKYQYILGVNAHYLNGEKEITHSVAFQEVPFLVDAEILVKAHSSLENYSWTHMNTWDCPYYMHCDRAESEHLWLACDGGFCRCIRTKFHNLQYGITSDDLRPLGGLILGYPGQIEVGDDDILQNRLLVIEDYFRSKEEALEDYEDFVNRPNPAYSAILDDVFGDG